MNKVMLTLNSIMFLLIRFRTLGKLDCVLTLNSIMFLLIQIADEIIKNREKTLNSIMFLLIQKIRKEKLIARVL